MYVDVPTRTGLVLLLVALPGVLMLNWWPPVTWRVHYQTEQQADNARQTAAYWHYAEREAFA